MRNANLILKVFFTVVAVIAVSSTGLAYGSFLDTVIGVGFVFATTWIWLGE